MSNDLKKFINEYFYDADKYIQERKNLLNKYKSDIDFITIKPVVIDTAINFLNSIDSRFPEKDIKEEIKNLDTMYQKYLEMNKKLNSIEPFFYEIYLHKITEYQSLYEEMQAINEHIKYLKTTLSKVEANPDMYHKNMKTNLVKDLDKFNTKKIEIQQKLIQIENKKKDEFFKTFPKILKNYLHHLKLVLNTIIMIMSKLIWVKAKNSSRIQNFFQNINKKISLKIFVFDYLKKHSFNKNPQIKEELEKLLKEK